MAKITWLKRFVVFYGLATIIVTVDKWFFGWILKFSPEKQALTFHYDTFVQMGVGQRLLGLANEGLLTIVFLMVLYHLYRVLTNVQIHQTFEQHTLSSLGKMAKLYLWYALLFPVTMAMQSVITSFHNPTGQRTLTISFGGVNFDQILMAGCLYVVWHVMQEAYNVSAENKMVI